MSASATNGFASHPSPGPRVFGIPFGDFGLFASLLISLSLGFMTFFAMTFLSIFGILLYNSTTHATVDLAFSYKFIAFPAGLIVLAVSLSTLGTVWLRRRVLGK